MRVFEVCELDNFVDNSDVANDPDFRNGMMVKDQAEIRQLLDDPATRHEGLLALGEWIIKTCLLFGAELPTAYQVAAIFTNGVKRSCEEKDNVIPGQGQDEMGKK